MTPDRPANAAGMLKPGQHRTQPEQGEAGGDESQVESREAD